MNECDLAIVGGGMVGSALGYGLARAGAEVVMLDQGDRDLRAARGNFGLLWVQGKGADCPAYAHWTLLSTRLWPSFAEELKQLTGIDVQYQRRGGIHYCLDDRELSDYADELARQAAVSDGAFQYQMLDARELQAFEPNLAPDLPGGGYSPNDGHVNPLFLLRALQAGFVTHGGSYRPRHSVQSIERLADGFLLQTEQGELRAGKVILAAGLDNQRLAPMLGLQQPLHPQRGQLLITERLPPLLKYPSIYLRQTGEGTIQIGDSAENSGLDDSNTVTVMAELAARAIRLLPALRQRRIVRGWGALRVLSPDGYPLYDRSAEAGPQAFAFSCHSGVTLAAAHALQLAPMLLQGELDSSLSAFCPRRFQD
ncbi:NAD(P)/FAD-dependent oxidoreductase [Marinobacterium arenosum]|uniref:NAD(P)/FAD-dependent oxidoreductase n=1 Tax=Marinobacterium arenosum TaxID=2862496 RepID=UPI001C95019A|nr:FAD-binding oxidoreductase [Marinobacterium arenosum]MBY4675358.1 FAD-binding oxidoreductase [Marinobacterium arenosum]